jgi:hypothetical protein
MHSVEHLTFVFLHIVFCSTNYVSCDEKNIPAEKIKKEAKARIQEKDADQRRTECDQGPKEERKEEANGIGSCGIGHTISW